MIFIGMIYQYDSTEGTGLLMLSDGDKREFSSSDWVDSVNAPAVGQKISYKSDANRIQIKVASEEDISKALAEKEKQSSSEENVSTEFEKQFANLDDCLEYFTDRGFKQVKDIQSDDLRTLTLRKYTEVEYGEAIIEQKGSRLSIQLTLNGKPVVMD